MHDHQQAVRAFLRRVCRDLAEAGDLAQETFLTAWSSIGRLRPGVAFRTWLCAIAWRKAQTAGRGRARSAARDRQWLDSRVDTTLQGGEDRAAVAKAMDALPLDQRAAVALGMPVGTVKSHVARGRAKLLEILGA